MVSSYSRARRPSADDRGAQGVSDDDLRKMADLIAALPAPPPVATPKALEPRARDSAESMQHLPPPEFRRHRERAAARRAARGLSAQVAAGYRTTAAAAMTPRWRITLPCRPISPPSPTSWQGRSNWGGAPWPQSIVIAPSAHQAVMSVRVSVTFPSRSQARPWPGDERIDSERLVDSRRPARSRRSRAAPLRSPPRFLRPAPTCR